MNIVLNLIQVVVKKLEKLVYFGDILFIQDLPFSNISKQTSTPVNNTLSNNNNLADIF
jgi:hypothetical protein